MCILMLREFFFFFFILTLFCLICELDAGGLGLLYSALEGNG